MRLPFCCGNHAIGWLPIGYQLGIVSVLPGQLLLLAGQGLKRLVPGVIKPSDHRVMLAINFCHPLDHCSLKI
tara:strand:+ start:425 stop:640 length:216 start_codon:yes stop_codon:yes gene_type:complete